MILPMSILVLYDGDRISEFGKNLDNHYIAIYAEVSTFSVGLLQPKGVE